jgi:hypothetical protein
MRSTPARREVAFVVAVAGAGLAAVLVVTFAPWYSADTGPSAEMTRVKPQVVRIVEHPDGSVALTP